MQNEKDRVGSLWEALKAVREDAAAVRASDAVEARLRTEVLSIGRRRRATRTGVLSLAAAAALAVAVTVTVRRAAVDRGDAPPPASGTATSHREVATAFFPLDYSGMPVSNGQLVRLEVPRAALASFGLTPIDVPDGGLPGTADGTVQADVLVGEDGVARAVRFIGRVGADEHRPVQESQP